MQNMFDNHAAKETITISNKFFYLISLIGFFGIFSTTISKTPVLPLLVKNGLGGSDAILGLISFFRRWQECCLAFRLEFCLIGLVSKS